MEGIEGHSNIKTTPIVGYLLAITFLIMASIYTITLLNPPTKKVEYLVRSNCYTLNLDYSDASGKTTFIKLSEDENENNWNHKYSFDYNEYQYSNWSYSFDINSKYSTDYIVTDVWNVLPPSEAILLASSTNENCNPNNQDVWMNIRLIIDGRLIIDRNCTHVSDENICVAAGSWKLEFIEW